MLVLNELDIVSITNSKDVIDELIKVTSEAFIAFEEGKTVTPNRIIFQLPNNSQSTMLIKPSVVSIPSENNNQQQNNEKNNSNENIVGMKIVSVVPSNYERNLPTVPGLVILFSPKTCLPISLLEATFFTGIRTAIGCTLATEQLLWNDLENVGGGGVSRNSLTLGIFGVGIQARCHLKVMLSRFGQNIVKVILFGGRSSSSASTNQEKMNSLVTDFNKRNNRNIESALGQIETNLNSCDIVVCATSSQKPLFHARYLKENAHIIAVGSYQPQVQEVDDSVIEKCSKIVIDTNSAFESGDLKNADRSRCIPLGIYLKKQKETTNQPAPKKAKIDVKKEEKKFTMFKSVGVAFQDVVCGQVIFEKANQLKLGTSLGMIQSNAEQFCKL